MIGILMPSVTFHHEMEHSYQKDSVFNQYKPLAIKYQVDLCMFSYRHIENNMPMDDALVYSYKHDTLIQKSVTLPRVNIVRNTSYVVNQGLIDKFKMLRNQNTHFINLPLYHQANKLQNYEHLHSIDHLRNHVPPTKRLTFEHLNSFIQQYGKVIIKPNYGSKGRGITIIEKGQNEYQVSQTSPTSHGSNTKKKTFPHSQLKQFYNKTFCRPETFLVQQWIPFKEYNGYPFDIRAVVQKNGKNRWQVTSWVARVANEKGHITNLNQGGEMVSLSKLQIKEYHRDIRKFCLKIAKIFEKLYPWVAEMGIDLAIDKHNNLWFIETNFCPEKIRWSTIFKTPFEYAYYIYSSSVRNP